MTNSRLTGVKFQRPVNICSRSLILGHSCGSLVHKRLPFTCLLLGGKNVERVNCTYNRRERQAWHLHEGAGIHISADSDKNL